MASGYFAGLMAILYRDTTDGRRVTSRRLAPFLPKRWVLVPPDAQARFERRTKQAHIAFLVALALGVQLIPDGTPVGLLFLAAGVAGIVAAALMKAWATRGLPAYDGAEATLVPVTHLEEQDRQGRAMGTRTVTGFLVLSVVLAAPQLFVALTERRWWAWLGFAMFGACALIFARTLIRLRGEQRARAQPTSSAGITSLP